MNTQRFIISVIAVFIFTFVYGFIVHGHLMMPMYLQTQGVWRSMAEMSTLMPWSIGTGIALAAAISFLFTRHYEGRGLHEGLRFGLYVGLIMGLVQFGAYTYLPIPLNLALAWLVVYTIEGIGIGLVLSLTYKA
jgi:hypothetical protein